MNPIENLFPPHAMAVVNALNGYDVRAVGGAVRAWLLNQPMDGVEIDLATTATPDEMAAAFKVANIPYDAGNARYGTVLAWPLDPEKRLEITTLRTDSYIPGSRYPTVAFTADWLADAARRDFTFNAISVSHRAEVYDPYNGEEHLKNGDVVFVGEPLQRMSEDPLRLLRFLRFCGMYGLGGATPDIAAELTTAAEALPSISRKKIAHELNRLLETPHAARVVNFMKHKEIWRHLPAEVVAECTAAEHG